MSDKKKRNLSKKEMFFYILSGCLAFIGLVFVVFGIIGDHLPCLASDNWVLISENAWLTNWSKMGYRWWGLILIGAGTLIGCISLTFFAQAGDRDAERALRRAQRLAIEAEPMPEPNEQAIEAETK